MQSIRNGYKGLSLLVDLNTDRIISTVALAIALLLGAWIASQTGVTTGVEHI